MIEVHVPGKKLVTSHSAEQKIIHKKIKPTLTPVINTAFKAMTRQVEDYVRQKRGDIKRHQDRHKIAKAEAQGSVAVEGVAPIDLGEGMCKWPLGDPQEADFVFCGRPLVSGTPYCAVHVALAYQSTCRMHAEKGALRQGNQKTSRL